MKNLACLVLAIAAASGGLIVFGGGFKNPYACFECGGWLDENPHPVTTLRGDTLGHCCNKCIPLYRDADNTR